MSAKALPNIVCPECRKEDCDCGYCEPCPECDKKISPLLLICPFCQFNVVGPAPKPVKAPKPPKPVKAPAPKPIPREDTVPSSIPLSAPRPVAQHSTAVATAPTLSPAPVRVPRPMSSMSSMRSLAGSEAKRHTAPPPDLTDPKVQEMVAVVAKLPHCRCGHPKICHGFLVSATYPNHIHKFALVHDGRGGCHTGEYGRPFHPTDRECSCDKYDPVVPESLTQEEATRQEVVVA